MANDYKLCPKCNNALDNNAMQCPYCWEKLWIMFWPNNYSQNSQILNSQTKHSKWCLIFFIIFFLLPFVWGVISFILWIISSIF